MPYPWQYPKRLIPAVPAWCTCGFPMYLWHLYLAIIHWAGWGSSADPATLTVRRPGRRVLGQACRGLFAILWFEKVPKKGRVLISPLHHHSFIKMMKKTPERKLDVLIQEGLQLLEPTEGTAMDYDCVVLTQMLGRDYEYKWLAEWRKQNPNLLVINDRVQGGPLTQEDTSCSDVTLYSVGQDKIPNTMGGGYAICHHSDELCDWMVTETEKLPFETAWARLTFVLWKLPTIMLYNIKPFNRFCEFLGGVVLGLDRVEIVMGYRKKNPGFMHDGFMIRPSPALLQSMNSLSVEGEDARWEAMQVACTTRFKEFYTHIPEDLKETISMHNSDTACSYFFVRCPNIKKSRALLAEYGCFSAQNQTYLAANKRSQPLVNNMLTLPMLLHCTDEEVKTVAAAVVECWRTIEKDAEEVVDSGTGYGTAAWAGLE